jgi:hypothetical protein
MEVKKDFTLKSSSSKATNLEEDGTDTDVDFSDEEVRLFVRSYNNYMKKKDFKHNKNFTKRRTFPRNKRRCMC